LAVAGAILGLTPASVLAAWTAASPLKPRPAVAGPRSSRVRAVAPRLAVSGVLATARIAGDTSKPAAAVTFGAELAAAVGAAAPWAVPANAETTRPLTSSSGTSHRTLVRSLTVSPLPLAVQPGGVVAG
jgi:hypothetical protein